MRLGAKKKRVLGLLLAIYLIMTFWSWRIFHQEAGRSETNNNENTAPIQHPRNANPLEDLSSVDYFACCGLGHRLIRMSLAAYVAKQRNFSLRSFWGWCGEEQPIEVFSYLFRPYPAREVAHVSSRNLMLPFYNEVPGFSNLVRKTTINGTECACRADKIQSDLELYTSLRDRFRGKSHVNAFVEQFSSHTVLGIHVRAGNGETGDFVRKGRTIDNPQEWVRHVCQLLVEFVSQHAPLPKPPILYIATDTPSMVTLFRAELEPANIPVLDLPQQGRREEGQGVLFGESDKVHNKGDNLDDPKDDYSSCLKGWMDTLTDMFLLSHADVVIAGKPSSFSQTLPMSLAFGNVQRKLPSAAYCEVIPQFEAQRQPQKQEQVNETTTTRALKEVAPTMQCYSNYLEWCCNYSTWNKVRYTVPHGPTKIKSLEFVKVLKPSGTLQDYSGMRNRTPDCLRPRRGRAGGGRKDKCLPHEW
jgi:hypothetical protein